MPVFFAVFGAAAAAGTTATAGAGVDGLAAVFAPGFGKSQSGCSPCGGFGLRLPRGISFAFIFATCRVELLLRTSGDLKQNVRILKIIDSQPKRWQKKGEMVWPLFRRCPRVAALAMMGSSALRPSQASSATDAAIESSVS